MWINGLALLPALVIVGFALHAPRRAVAILTVSGCAIIISYVLAHVNRWFGLWPAHPYFPSGHETFASCCWTVLTLLDRRSAIPAIVALALLAYSLVIAGWHGRLDVVGGFVLGLVVSAAVAAFVPSMHRARGA